MKARKNLMVIVLAALALLMTTGANASEPKYVFFFLGDGMASSQIQATEAYLTTINGGKATEAADPRNPKTG